MSNILACYRSLPLPYRQHNPRRIRTRVIDALGGFTKISIAAQLVIRHELLRVARHQREPGALDLHHDAMASLERVHDAGHHERDFGGCVRSQWNRSFKAVAKAGRERLAAQKHFVATWFE